MSRATPKIREFAERLIAYETRGNNFSETKPLVAFLVDERLRPHLVTLMGSLGFRALLSRALVLTNTEVPWLRAVHVKTDGSLEGLNELKAHVGPEDFFKGSVVLLAQFLELLVTLIGEDLTLRLVGEIWPTLSLNNLGFGEGGK
jgi:hypothetical protein